MQIAWGTGVGLEERLGPATRGHHLPGLGEIAGWGVVADEEATSGMILTEFHTDPTSVVFWLSARTVGQGRLELSSVNLLTSLPQHLLGSFSMMSFVSDALATRIADRGQVAVETISNNASLVCERLITHLVAESVVQRTQVHTGVRRAVWITSENCRVTAYREVDRSLAAPANPSNDLRTVWQRIIDWE
jgi:hypothetical protein